MTQKNKELLLRDLTARATYGVKVLNTTYKNHDIQTVLGVVGDEVTMVETYTSVRGDDFEFSSTRHYTGRIDSVKPYLRPMESMTQEERKEYAKLLFPDLGGIYEDYYKAIDWLHEHHFDYRGLIEKGLAIAVTENNNPYKEERHN